MKKNKSPWNTGFTSGTQGDFFVGNNSSMVFVTNVDDQGEGDGPVSYETAEVFAQGGVIKQVLPGLRGNDEEISKLLQGRPVTVLQQMEREERDKVLRKIKAIQGGSLRQIARITGLGLYVIHQA